MSEKLYVYTVDEWLVLPELPMKAIKHASESGTTFHVLKVGILPALEAVCKERDIDAPVFTPGKRTLPTIVIQDVSGRSVLYRLPIGLAEWAAKCVAMAHTIGNSFPRDVEFGILNGRLHAEML